MVRAGDTCIPSERYPGQEPRLTARAQPAAILGVRSDRLALAEADADLERDPSGAGHYIVTASIRQEVPIAGAAGQSAAYELTFACNGRTRRREMKLATY